MMPSGPSEPIRAGGCTFPWFFLFGMFGFLTFNSIMAVLHSKGDAAIVAFVATSYGDLVLLFGCIWFYKRAAPGSPQRDQLKASVWILTTVLTFAFGYMVMGASGAGLTLPVALLVWAVAAATAIGAYFAFFQQDRASEAPNDTMQQMV